jgi:cytochrome c-type biogenesis protein CcmH
MGMIGRAAIGLVLLLRVAPAFAVLPSEMLPDPTLEARARALSAELRCMVCQNQSIDDSEAPLAADLRVLVRERLMAGDSDEQVLDFLVARYGEFILLKPRFNWHTALLWATPPAVLILGGIVAVVGYSHRRRAALAPAPLEPEEQEALQSLVSDADRPNITET